MINLVPAKCPSCGAQLELDDNLKRTECKFCRTTIIVDEAIQKYEVEIEGKVKVSGIQDENDKLDNIRKFLKVGKNDEAEDLLDEFLEDNPFNLEANKLFIELHIPKAVNYENIESYLSYKAPFISEIYFSDYIEREINDKINNLQKLSENINDYKDFIEKTKSDLLNYTEVREKYNSDKRELINLIKKYISSKKRFKKILDLFCLTYNKEINDPTESNILDYYLEEMELINVTENYFTFKASPYELSYKSTEKLRIDERLKRMKEFLDGKDSKNGIFKKFFS